MHKPKVYLETTMFNYFVEETVDRIRDTIYLTTKEMTPQERAAYINSLAREVLKKQQQSKSAEIQPQRS